MPPYFFFDLSDGLDIIRDKEGISATSLDEAFAAAQEVMHEMRAQNNLPQRSEGWQLEVRDERGTVLMRLLVG